MLKRAWQQRCSEASREARIRAFRDAADKHVRRARECQNAQAPGQHLWQMQLIALKHGAALGIAVKLTLFDSPGWKTMRGDFLSTSSAGSKNCSLFGFGATSKQCIGIGYIVWPQSITAYLSTPQSVESAMQNQALDRIGHIVNLQDFPITRAGSPAWRLAVERIHEELSDRGGSVLRGFIHPSCDAWKQKASQPLPRPISKSKPSMRTTSHWIQNWKTSSRQSLPLSEVMRSLHAIRYRLTVWYINFIPHRLFSSSSLLSLKLMLSMNLPIHWRHPASMFCKPAVSIPGISIPMSTLSAC